MTVSPFYFIVGAPRSGTSALALVLKEQGIPMYFCADAPDLDSPSGNQEDNLARLINNTLMAGGSGGRRCDWDRPCYVRTAKPPAERLLRSYISSRGRSAGGGSWGMKDPRLCFTLEPWHAATRDLPVRWIHIRREEREASVRSLIRMLPAKIRLSQDSEAVDRLASSWLESYLVASELGFERTGIEPLRVTYESLLTPQGREALRRELQFNREISCIQPTLNRQGESSLARKGVTRESH